MPDPTGQQQQFVACPGCANPNARRFDRDVTWGCGTTTVNYVVNADGRFMGAHTLSDFCRQTAIDRQIAHLAREAVRTKESEREAEQNAERSFVYLHHEVKRHG